MRSILTLILLLASGQAAAQPFGDGLFPDLVPYVNGDGTVNGDIDLNGTYKLILDADADSYLYSSSDDVVQLYLSNGGVIYTSASLFRLNSALSLQWKDRTILTSPADGDLLITNAAATYALRLRVTADGSATFYSSALGGAALTASSFNGTAYVRSGTTIKAQLGSYAATEMKPPGSDTVTFASNPGDASKTATGLIPKGCFLTGFSSRVVTTGTNCTSVDIGIAGDLDAFANDTGIADGDTTDNEDTASGVASGAFSIYTAATDVTVTGVGGSCFDLKVDLYAHCMTTTAASSDLP